MKTVTNTRPLIVLAGWLGCQPRSLRRYETFFSQHGYEVLSKIAPPSLVVHSCFQPPQNSSNFISTIPSKWPVCSPNESSLQDYAWNLLGQIQRDHSQASYILFYAFSNGGCFVWEQIRNLLQETVSGETRSKLMKCSATQQSQISNIQQLQSKIAGVIFDSCPNWQLEFIGHALQHCTPEERHQVLETFPEYDDVVQTPYDISSTKQQQAQRRGVEYFDGLKNDNWYIPQLYLYSPTDALIPHAVVDELFQHRQKHFGNDLIQHYKFNASRHCAHLVDHPQEYEYAVKSFLSFCQERIQKQPEQARLSSESEPTFTGNPQPKPPSSKL